MAWLPDGEKISKISLFVLAQLTNVTDRQTDTRWRHIPRLCIASLGKNAEKTSSAEPPQKKQKVEVECDLLAEYKTSCSTAAESLECTDTRHELDKYLSLPVRDSNPLYFWKLHEQQLPILAVLARKLLAIPATSTPSKQVFFVCGATLNKRRARTNTETLEQLVFLKYNMCP